MIFPSSRLFYNIFIFHEWRKRINGFDILAAQFPFNSIFISILAGAIYALAQGSQRHDSTSGFMNAGLKAHFTLLSPKHQAILYCLFLSKWRLKIWRQSGIHPDCNFLPPEANEIMGQEFQAEFQLDIFPEILKNTNPPQPSRVDFASQSSPSFKRNHCTRANGANRS